MKKMYKAMLLVLCAVLLVVASVMGTLAYLQMQTGTVKNTFTVGKVEITLKEYGLNADYTANMNDKVDKLENITLVPGRTIGKNPFITVAQGSEKCYLFVKLVNNIPAAYGEINGFTGNWAVIDEANHIYAYTGALATNGVIDASENAKTVDVFTSFTCKSNVTAYNGETNLAIEITAYAVQAEGFNSAAEAWTAASGNFT